MARFSPIVASAVSVLACPGCRYLVQATDREVAAAIAERQAQALDYSQPIVLAGAAQAPPEAGRQAYEYHPHPITAEVPAGFQPRPVAESRPAAPRLPASQPLTTRPAAPTQLPRLRERVFTLTDALAYAQQHRREYQTAKEDLYLVALALTLERHLWTPIFASNLRTVYGNFGEVTDFDQAMRFVADLSVSQRLPYGGEFTAAMISTLIRDVGHSITASEGSQVELGLKVPFLRNAGHVAREDLIQLERDLTYAVRSFERFRRQQLVLVAQAYFGLLRAKQDVLDSAKSLERFRQNFQRAAAFEAAGQGAPLDTRRAEQSMLAAENALADRREAFRFQTDTFKLLIGMPVSEPLGMGDLEDFEAIAAQIKAGRYPLLRPTPAAEDEQQAIAVATRHRLDLLNRRDQVDDARRGVAVARNALLPDLDWTSTLTFDTDPEHFNTGAFEVARASWRSELLLALPLERTRERNQYRSALIDVRRAQRAYQDLLEQIRVDVRRAINRIRLEETSLEIQRRNLDVSDSRLEFAQIQYEEGLISNRDLVEAEDDWTAARNRLNLAQTSRWGALLDFRLATGTLRVDEHGVQQPVAELPASAPAAAGD